MEELTLIDCLAILRRWKTVFLAVTCVLMALSIVFAVRWSTYRSTATVQIEAQEIAATATTPIGVNPRDAMDALADQRISELQQKVMSTASLIEVITKFDLYASKRKSTPIADVAESMRKKIKVDLVSTNLANPASAGKVSADDLSAIAFTLSFDYSDPLISQQVTDELVSRFLDQDLKERRAKAHETSEFLAAQITTLETSMAEQESKIAEFQKTHGSSRPESLAFNQQTAASLTFNLESLNSQITANEGQLGALHAQLAGVDPYSRVIADGQLLTTPSVQLKALQAQYASLTAQYGPEHPDVIKIKHQIASLQKEVGGNGKQNAKLKAQIEDVRTNLEASRESYGPDHPDVIALQNELQKLEDQLATTHSPVSSDNGIITDADNPAYLSLVSEIHAAEEQRKSLLDQRKELQAQQESYQKAITENPAAAQEMETLARDYENTQLRYRELKEKKMGADMEEQMQNDRHGGRLTLINPPELPSDTHPARILIFIAGLLFSLIGGSISLYIAQTLSQSVLGAHQLGAIVGVAPLVAIPHISTIEERQKSLQQRIFRLIQQLYESHVRRLIRS